MLRSVSSIYRERQAVEIIAGRWETYRSFKLGVHSNASQSASNTQTVIKSETKTDTTQSNTPSRPDITVQTTASLHTYTSGSSGGSDNRWKIAGAAVAVTASIAGVYLYRTLGDEPKTAKIPAKEAAPIPAKLPVVPASPELFPAHVTYLIAGGGTAGFAGLRTLRSQQPDATTLLVTTELVPPYMRPPLSKELWKEDIATLALRLRDPESLTYKQWNGKRRGVFYEPSAFYTPVEQLSESGGAASLAQGWKVTKIDVPAHVAELESLNGDKAIVSYEKCLIATGTTANRVQALEPAAKAGKSFALRTLEDAKKMAEALSDPSLKRLAIIGGGHMACELSASLSEQLVKRGVSVVMVHRNDTLLQHLLPQYLAEETSARLQEMGVTLYPNAEVVSSTVEDGRVEMVLSDGGRVSAGAVIECVGGRLYTDLFNKSQLELGPAEDGHLGLVVNAELQARTDVFGAGDAISYHDVVRNTRRQCQHHDHAVASARRAATNMLADKDSPAQPYDHVPMFWSDLGPDLGYEAIGVIDSRLPTVAVFSEDAVTETAKVVEVNADSSLKPSPQEVADPHAAKKRYNRGVVFYKDGSKVVGVLLWNLFNRMHLARQVLAQGEFEDLFEVAKLFTPHEEE